MLSSRRALHTAGLLLFLVLPHGLAAVDCNRNGIEDHLDVVQGRSDDCNTNDIPDECDVRVVNLGYSSGSFMVPVRPTQLATDDLDGDGSVDIAAPCEPPGSVLLVWNQASGFEYEVLTDPGTTVRLLETGDVDGDGMMDLVIVTRDAIQVLANAGARNLAPRELSDLPFEASALALGDLNRDGDLDAVAAGPFHVAVLGNVSGWTFEPVNRIPLGSGPIAVFVDDLERDGDLDIVTGNADGNVSSIIRRDDGTFAIPRNFSAGGPPGAFASADLDLDGNMDVAALSSQGDLTVLLQAEGMRFAPAGTVPTGIFGTAIAAADLDVDGDPDLASIHRDGLGIFRSRGDGSLGPEIRPRVPTPAFISPADLDGDGIPDFAAGYREGRIGVISAIPVANSLDCNADQVPDECQLGASDCNGNSIPDGCDLAGSSRDCNGNLFPDECEADCDGNGIPDECDLSRWGRTRDCNGNGVLDVCDIGSGLLRFERSPRTGLSGWSLPRRAASADLDGDEDGDLVIFGYHWFEARLGVLFQEDDHLDLRSLLAREGSFTAFDLGDLDRDGDVDLAATAKGGRIRVYKNPGNGELAGPIEFEHEETYPYGEDLALADWDGDGNLDAAARAGKGLGGIAVLWNDGRGSFPRASHVEAGTSFIDGFRRANLDGNSAADLLIVDEPESGRWQLLGLLGAATRTFEVGRAFALEGQPSSLASADLDRDGNEDIVVPISGLTALWVFRNDGTGALDAKRQPLSLPLWSVLSGDLNLDGHADLVGLSILGSTEALLNRGDGSFGSPRRIAEDGWWVFLEDVNSDRAPDIVVAGEYYMIEFPANSWLEVLANRSLAPESTDADRDGVPDECEDRPFRRGDVAADGRLDMADAVTVLDGLFRGRAPLECASAADVDGDGDLGITDPIFLLRHLFLGGPPPPFPGPPPSPCAADPNPVTRGGLGCAFHPGCER